MKVNGIEFHPHKWEFDTDGMWGHIFFKVKKNTFEYGSNNGAYCKPYKGSSNPLEEEDEVGKYDLVHMATPCMEDGDDLDRFNLSYTLEKAAKEICSNLRSVK